MTYRVGNIIPSSNLKVEPILARLAFGHRERLAMHYHRTRVKTIDREEGSLGQFSFDRLLQASEMLQDAEPDIIAWHGTAAMYVNFDDDLRFVELLEETQGVAGITTSIAVRDYVVGRNITSVFLVSPFDDDTTERIRSWFLKHTTATTVDHMNYGLQSSIDIARLDNRELARDIEAAASGDHQLLLSPCTNIDFTALVSHLARKITPKVVDVTEITFGVIADRAGLSGARIAS